MKPLTPREKQTYDLIVEGYTNQEIGKKLGIKPKSVKWNITHIFKSQGITSRAKLIVKHYKLLIEVMEYKEKRKR